MFVDYPLHCDSSFDSIAMASMIQASIDMGMDHFCLTDHLDFDVRFSRLCETILWTLRRTSGARRNRSHGSRRRTCERG